MSTITYDISELQQTARRLLDAYPDERFFAFYGHMGAGKTTLIKQLCHCLGTADNVCSPTFAIVNEYLSANGDPLYHFDFYRIKNLEEAYDMGCNEYFYSGNYCFCEWTENIEPLLPDHYLKITIEGQDNLRQLTTEIVDQ